LAHLFLIIFGWIWLAPIIVTIVGGVSALRAQGRRWIIHLCVFGFLLAALPAFISLWSTIDPNAASEPTNAFTALLYLIVMVAFGLAYSIFALVLFYKRSSVGWVEPLRNPSCFVVGGWFDGFRLRSTHPTSAVRLE
jgi:hypothetical protein